jgi:hypothetical protein
MWLLGAALLSQGVTLSTYEIHRNPKFDWVDVEGLAQTIVFENIGKGKNVRLSR